MLKASSSVKSREPPTTWPDRLREVLRHVPIVEVLAVRQESADLRELVDAEVDLKVANKVWTLLIETKSSGQPRHVREAAARLGRALAADRRRVYGAVVAPFLSAQSQEILRTEGLGWLDLAGNSQLSFGGLHIEIDKAQREPIHNETGPAVFVRAEVGAAAARDADPPRTVEGDGASRARRRESWPGK